MASTVKQYGLPNLRKVNLAKLTMAVVHRTIDAQMNAVLFNFKRISATQLENVRHRKYAVLLLSRIAYCFLLVSSTRLRCDLEDILYDTYTLSAKIDRDDAPVISKKPPILGSGE